MANMLSTGYGYARNDSIIHTNQQKVDTTKIVALDEVVVYAAKPLIEDDGHKMVYNVAMDPTNISATSIDILRKIPMVFVSPDGIPSIKGNSNVKILINGKETQGLSLTQVMEQVSPGEIRKVEVITSPSVRYAADGTAGIINIITRKRNYLKRSGYINVGAGTKGSHLMANYTHKFGDNWSLSNSFYGLLSYSDIVNTQEFHDGERNLRRNESHGKSRGNLYSDQLSLTRQTKRMELSVYMNIYYQRMKQEEMSEATEFTDVDSEMRNGYSFYKGGVSYKLNLPGRLTISATAETFYLPINNRMTIYGNDAEYKYAIVNNTDNLDIEYRPSTALALNAGGGFSFNSFRDRNRTTMSARQSIVSAYGEGTYKVSPKLSLNAGLRLENYGLRGWDVIGNNNTQLFLNAAVRYRFTNTSILSLSVSRRIQRPSYYSLLPIENYESSHDVSVGNPNLRSEISYNYEIGFSKYFGSQFIKIAPFYSYANNKISVLYAIKGGMLQANYTNLDNEKRLGISLWASIYLLRKRLTINYGLDLFRKYMSYHGNNENGTCLLNNINISCRITNWLSAAFFGSYNTPSVYMQGKESSYVYSNASLQTSFADGKIRLALSLDNPFSSSVVVKRKYHIDQFMYKNELSYHNRGVRIFAIYRFGKNKPGSISPPQGDILKQ
jgi:outer membrane receptor protein involved in Fe transport